MVEQYGCVSKAGVKSMWVKLSAMDSATFGLFGGLVTDIYMPLLMPPGRQLLTQCGLVCRYSFFS